MLAGMLGYALAAAAFAGLALLMVASWRGRLEGGLLLVALVLSAVWAGLSAWDMGAVRPWPSLPAAELLRSAAWLVFLGRITPVGQGRAGSRWHWLVFAPAVFLLVFGLFDPAGMGTAQPANEAAGTLVYAGLFSAVVAFFFLEQFYRGLAKEQRRAVTPLVIGVGGIFAYDLFLYSEGLLFGALRPELWAARGFVNLLAVPLVMLASRRNQMWSIEVFVSRYVTFYGMSLVGIGLYFLAIAALGYWLETLGTVWGPVLQTVFFFAAAGLLAWLLFSPVARARLKVFIAKHFYSSKYDYRHEWLRLTAALSAPDADPDLGRRCLKAMAALVEADAGVLWLHRNIKSGEAFERIAVLGEVGDAPGGLEVTDPAVDFMARRKWTIDVAQSLREPQSHPGLELPEWIPHMGRSMLIVPLLGGDTLWGIAALLRPRSVGKLTYEDIDLLKVAGMQVAAILAQGEADRLLAESRQFEAYNRFAAFIMHDLKNIIAQQSLLVRNAARHKADPAFVDDLVDTVENSVRRMQRLLEQLRRGQGKEVTERVGLGKLLSEVAHQHRDRAPVPEVVPVDPAIRLHTHRERLAAVLGHLVANAQDATPAEGRVRIGAAMADRTLVTWVEDSGAGMDEDFIRNRLFKPFDSTKGTQGMGIGAYQARQFVEAAGGEGRVSSTPGEGTRFELRFPATLVDGLGEREKEAMTMNGPGREAAGG